jgi:hypothetical protein
MVVRGVVLQVIRRLTAIDESNIKILSAIEFKRQLQENYFLPRDDGFATFFRPLLETPIVAARSKSGGKMSDEEVLAEVRRIDYSPVALLSGPHVECITYEGTLKFEEPTLHSVQVFTNRFLDIWVLREKTYTEKAWRTYALAQDKTVEPNVARYYQLRFDDSGMLVVRTRGATCYECHASGPRAMRGIRADLISGHRYADEMNTYIRGQDPVVTRFTREEPRIDCGEELHIAACIECHSSEGQRGPLYRVHRLSINVLTKNAQMPPQYQKPTTYNATAGGCMNSLPEEDLAAIAKWLGPAESNSH